MKIHEVNIYSNAIPQKPYCFWFWTLLAGYTSKRALFITKLSFSIFRIFYRHFLPTDKQYQCNIMLSLLSQVGHSLPFLRLERFFTESRCAIFTYCCFRVLSNNKKSYFNPKLASRKVIPIFYFYETSWMSFCRSK